jgi:hypothetical protein
MLADWVVMHVSLYVGIIHSCLSTLCSHTFMSLLRRLPSRPRSKHLLPSLRTRPSRCTSASAPPSPGSRLSVLLCIDLLNRLLDFLCRQHFYVITWGENGYLNVLGACLDDFEKGFYGQLDCAGAVEGRGVVALEEFTDGFGGAADGVCFPVVV